MAISALLSGLAGASGASGASGAGSTLSSLAGLSSPLNTNPLGAIGGIALGAGQMISGAIKRKQADALIPSVEDPMSRQYLNTIRRRRQAVETGTANTADRAAIRQAMKTYGTQAFKAGGPVNTGVLTNLMSESMKNLAASKGAELSQLYGLEGQQVSEMAQRKFDIGMYRSQVKSAQAEQAISAGQDNLLGSLGTGKNKGIDYEKLAKQIQKQNQKNG